MFGVCKADAEEEDDDDSIVLPKPPPPPPRRPSATKEEWFPGKFFSQVASVAREKIDELPSISSHNKDPEPSSTNNEVSRLFPNTTRTIEKERGLRAKANQKEFDQIEKWWVAQLLSEADDDDEQKNLLAKGKPVSIQPLPSDPRWAFEARIMHPACAGILRIILHFVTEFLANDVVNVVSQGGLGHWTLPSLIQAFIVQIENMLASDPLWRAEYTSFIPYDVRDRHVDETGTPLTPQQDQKIKAQSAPWESSCDELENFIFRKIGAVLLPSKQTTSEKISSLPPPPPPPALQGEEGMSSLGYGYGQTGSRPERSVVVFERLRSMNWVSSTDLGVAWGGLDKPEMWVPAAKELTAMSSCQTPSEMLECLVRCFAHVSSALVQLLEDVRLRDLDETSSSSSPINKEASIVATSPVKQALLSASSMSEHERSTGPDSSDIQHRPTFTGEDVSDDQTTGSRWSFESKGFGATSNTPFANLPCADDVLPAVILVLLQANPRHVLAYLDFALAFRSKSRLSSEGHYFIITLTSAVHFILDIEPEQLGMTDEEFKRRVSLASERNRMSLSASEASEGAVVKEEGGIPLERNDTMFEMDGLVGNEEEPAKQDDEEVSGNQEPENVNQQDCLAEVVSRGASSDGMVEMPNG